MVPLTKGLSQMTADEGIKKLTTNLVLTETEDEEDIKVHTTTVEVAHMVGVGTIIIRVLMEVETIIKTVETDEISIEII